MESKHTAYTTYRLPTLEEHILRDRPMVDAPTAQPDNRMVGFVPILPANRNRGLVFVNEQPKYTEEYKRNYYTLRDAIERDQYDRRGGYRAPYAEPVALLMLVVYKPESLGAYEGGDGLFDGDGIDKTFIDALTQTSRLVAGGEHDYMRHIQDGSLIAHRYVITREAKKGELEGVWYALRRIDSQGTEDEEFCELLSMLAGEKDKQAERREFDLTNLSVAKMDGEAYARGEECWASNLLDPTYSHEPHKRVRIARTPHRKKRDNSTDSSNGAHEHEQAPRIRLKG